MAATGPEGVLRLLEQCKTMERHLTAILMECLLKLSSATSTGVFLLVEDSVDGMRKIAGSAKLSNAFKSCALVPTGEEAELFLDDPNPAIYERPIKHPTPPPPQLPPQSHLGGVNPLDYGTIPPRSTPYDLSSSEVLHNRNNAIQRLSRKRLSDGIQCGESGGGSNRSKHFKRAYKPTFLPPPPSSSTAAEIVEIKDETHDEEDSPDNLTVSFNNSPGIESNDGEPEAAESPAVIAAVPSSVSDADGHGRKAGSGGGGEGREGRGGGVANAGVALNLDTVYPGFSNAFMPSNYSNTPIDASMKGREGLDTGRQSSPSSHTPTINQDYGFDVEKFLMENDKYRAVANIRDPAIMEKSNIANKLLTSLLYDISKSIVIHSPYRENKNKQNSEYFNQVFEIVWEHLPYLNELNDTRAKFNGKSPRYYVRHTMQAYYIVLMSKCVSQAQNQSAGYRAIRFLD